MAAPTSLTNSPISSNENENIVSYFKVTIYVNVNFVEYPFFQLTDLFNYLHINEKFHLEKPFSCESEKRDFIWSTSVGLFQFPV